MTAEITTLSARLKLSTGDLLGLAREVAQDNTLRSVEHLTSLQRRQLEDLLTLLAQPIPARLQNLPAYVQRYSRCA